MLPSEQSDSPETSMLWGRPNLAQLERSQEDAPWPHEGGVPVSSQHRIPLPQFQLPAPSDCKSMRVPKPEAPSWLYPNSYPQKPGEIMRGLLFQFLRSGGICYSATDNQNSMPHLAGHSDCCRTDIWPTVIYSVCLPWALERRFSSPLDLLAWVHRLSKTL